MGSFFLGPHLLAGDQYRTGTVRTTVVLPPGVYSLRLRVRAKVQASFSCSVQAVRPAAINGVAAGRGVNTASPLVLHKPVHIPDLWLGRLSNAATLAIPVTNGAATWLRSLQVEVESSVACEPTSAAADDSDSVDGCVRLVALPRPQGAALALAPGQSSPVGVRLALGTSTCVAVSLRDARDAGVVACRGRALTVPESSCPLPFRVRARGRFEHAGSDKEGASVAVSSGWMSAQLRCRGPGDSFAFTFTGGDGSVRTAAAIAPLPLPRDSVSTTQGGLPATVPVMLTMHGTGVSAQSQADAYKVPCTTVGRTLRRVLSLMLLLLLLLLLLLRLLRQKTHPSKQSTRLVSKACGCSHPLATALTIGKVSGAAQPWMLSMPWLRWWLPTGARMLSRRRLIA